MTPFARNTPSPCRSPAQRRTWRRATRACGSAQGRRFRPFPSVYCVTWIVWRRAVRLLHHKAHGVAGMVSHGHQLDRSAGPRDVRRSIGRLHRLRLRHCHAAGSRVRPARVRSGDSCCPGRHGVNVTVRHRRDVRVATRPGHAARRRLRGLDEEGLPLRHRAGRVRKRHHAGAGGFSLFRNWIYSVLK